MPSIQKSATTASHKANNTPKLKLRHATRTQRLNGRRKSRIYEEYALSSLADADWDEASDLSQILQTLYVGH